MSIAGGIVLFLIGIRMIFPRPEGLMGEIPDGEPFIVPLAIPLVAGPSGMAAVMLMGSSEPDRLGSGRAEQGFHQSYVSGSSGAAVVDGATL